MPNRILKESICTSATVEALKYRQAEVLFYRLLVTVDDFGCYDGRPEIIRARCFPLAIGRIGLKTIERWLADLERVGLLVRYEHGNKPYIALRQWMNHQRLRVKNRRWPEPPCDNLLSDASDCPHMPADDGPNPKEESEGGIRRRKEEEKQPPAHAVELASLIVSENPNVKQQTDATLKAWAWEIDRALRLDRNGDGSPRWTVDTLRAAILKACRGEKAKYVLSAKQLRKDWFYAYATDTRGKGGYHGELS